MTQWIFLSKDSKDPYINKFAQGCRCVPVDSIDYNTSQDPIVFRSIMKHKLIKQCWQDQRDFYYMDTGYFGNNPGPGNKNGWKYWHRIVKNNLQHNDIIARPNDRWIQHNIKFQSRRHGSKIIVAAPDDKPCIFYGINREQWITQTVNTIKQYTDRPVIVRERAPNREDRISIDPLQKVLINDVHALVTFNSLAAVESVLLGIPTFTLAPVHAAGPVSSQDLSQIDNPYYPDQDKLYAWACHLAYGQFHVSELEDGTAYRILNDN